MGPLVDLSRSMTVEPMQKKDYWSQASQSGPPQKLSTWLLTTVFLKTDEIRNYKSYYGTTQSYATIYKSEPNDYNKRNQANKWCSYLV